MLVSSILWIAEMIEEWALLLVCSFFISCGICYAYYGGLITLVWLCVGVVITTLTLTVLRIRDRYYKRMIDDYEPYFDISYQESRKEIEDRIPDNWDPS
jgi:hypothetical protein